MSDATTTHSFKAEVSQVLHLVVNSLYSHKEVFLRELVSNASDALDKLRFEAVSRADLLPAGEELEIRIEADESIPSSLALLAAVAVDQRFFQEQ